MIKTRMILNTTDTPLSPFGKRDYNQEFSTIQVEKCKNILIGITINKLFYNGK